MFLKKENPYVRIDESTKTLPPSTFHRSLVHFLLVYQILNAVEVVAENINSGFGDHNT